MVDGLVVASFDKWILWYRFRPTFDSRDRDLVFIAPKFIAINLFLIICVSNWELNSYLGVHCFIQIPQIFAKRDIRMDYNFGGVDLILCDIRIKKWNRKWAASSVYVLWHHHHQRWTNLFKPKNLDTAVWGIGVQSARENCKTDKHVNAGCLCFPMLYI